VGFSYIVIEDTYSYFSLNFSKIIFILCDVKRSRRRVTTQMGMIT
jgi:hypothetical protein